MRRANNKTVPLLSAPKPGTSELEEDVERDVEIHIHQYEAHLRAAKGRKKTLPVPRRGGTNAILFDRPKRGSWKELGLLRKRKRRKKERTNPRIIN